MASSTYYYNQYKNYKKQAKEYGDNISELQKIYNSVTNDLYGKIQPVNNEIDNLVDDLKKSVRNNGSFDSSTNSLYSKKEKGVTADHYMRTVVSELQDEINELNRKKNDAEDDRDYNYNLYKQKQKEERDELFRKLFGG